MKNGKKPTAKQRKLMQKRGVDCMEWLVCKDTSTELVIVHREKNESQMIVKGR
jgi:hypothetical protein